MVIGEIICRFEENLQEILIVHSDITFKPLLNEGSSHYKVDEEILNCEKKFICQF